MFDIKWVGPFLRIMFITHDYFVIVDKKSEKIKSFEPNLGPMKSDQLRSDK